MNCDYNLRYIDWFEYLRDLPSQYPDRILVENSNRSAFSLKYEGSFTSYSDRERTEWKETAVLDNL